MLGNGAIRLLGVGGAIVTAAMLLDELDDARDRALVEAALRDNGLDAGKAVDVLAARAFVWTMWWGPVKFWNLPYPDATGSAAARATNLRAARSVMAFERANPGTLGAATSGNTAAQYVIQVLVDEAVDESLGLAEPMYRTSAVSPALSTDSATARSLVAAQTRMQDWQAHHLIPFAVMAEMPASLQVAAAASGWLMDSVENLIALPANEPSFENPPNSRFWPMHNTSHAIYDGVVTGFLLPALLRGIGKEAREMRVGLFGVETVMTTQLVSRRFHDRVR